MRNKEKGIYNFINRTIGFVLGVIVTFHSAVKNGIII